MSRLVLFGPDASTELSQAARWYEQRRAGLGVRFLVAVDVAVRSAVHWPQSGAPVRGVREELQLRRLRVDRFPYHLVYLVADDVIHVLAVAHDRRRPGYWRSRVEP
ncbi:MAG TPA: type II toxin-antitoxin system RelE/ParE family toxin [Acidimicrobiales bacterium]|nr:type II toxin-antitoxin system RelE/ParE family toxin [Acidimicrobiales bacterium]